MKRAVVCLFVLVTRAAHAAEPAAPEAQPAGESSFESILLPLTLSGATDGKGILKFGGGVAFAAGSRTDVALSLNTSIATLDGAATLVEKRTDEELQQTTPWDLGVSLAVATLNAPIGGDPDAGLPDSVRRHMFDACNERCSPGSSDAFCKGRAVPLARLLKDLDSQLLPPAQFCQAEQAKVRMADGLVAPPVGADPVTFSPSPASVEQQKAGRRNALNSCAAACLESRADAFCSLTEVRDALDDLYYSYDANALCSEGIQIYDEYEDAAGRSLYPVFQFTVGGGIGRQKFKYREDTAGVLLEGSSRELNGKVGASTYWLPGETRRIRTTLEASLLFESSTKASEKTVRWCTPAGAVPIVEPEAGEEVGPTVPGESCREGVLGAPTRSTDLTVSFRVGLLDGSRDAWRVAFGPQLTIPRAEGDWKPVELALQLPMYAAATLFPGVDYKGILRLTPSAGWRRTSDGEQEYSVVAELALLGQRRIISDRFDEL